MNIKLDTTEEFELLLAGNSVINGYIEVPANAKLTIDSKENPGSESGKLAITSDNNTAIGSDSGATGGYPNNTTSVGAVILITGGTVVASGGDAERIFLGSSNGKPFAAAAGGQPAGAMRKNARA